MRQNIPGLDAPSWSRISGNDEQQEEEEERQAEQRWQQQQKAGVKTVTYTAAAAASSSAPPAAAAAAVAAPLSCDLLVVACGMLSSAFLSTMIDGLDGAASPLQEIGRFTVAVEDTGAPAVASTKQSRAEAARPYALILASLPGASTTIYAFNYLRATAPQYFDLTAALFAQVSPKQVMLLDTMHHGAFITQERPTPCPPLLRMLQSTAVVSAAPSAAAAAASVSPSSSAPAVAAAIPTLETPNLVYTLSASLLTHAEIARLPARLYLSMESRHYVVETLQAFEAAWEPFLSTLASDSAVALRLISKQFLSCPEKRRIAGYKAATARVQKVYGYSAGQDSSMRETAGQVQRDHQLEMFF